VSSADTEEELQDEMRRWVAGINDPHDDVIDYVKAKIKTEKEEEERRGIEHRKALAKAMEDEGFTSSQIVPLTGDAGRDLLARVQSKVPGVSRVVQDQGHNSAYDKYIKNNPRVGTLRVDESGAVTGEKAVDAEQMLNLLRSPKEGEKKDTLQEDINSRQPTWESLEGRDPNNKGVD